MVVILQEKGFFFFLQHLNTTTDGVAENLTILTQKKQIICDLASQQAIEKTGTQLVIAIDVALM